MSCSDIEARWVKFGSVKEFIFLGDDVIAIASGIHIMFLNLVTREEKIERFDNAERGRGASCLAGHSVVPMFATAERRSHPRVFIFTYPGINRVSCCSLEKNPNGYLASVFVGTEYLLTLTDFPNFQIIIWLWRTGECLTSIDTNITDHDQRISCSPSSPYLVSQIGKKTGKLLVYEISVCSRIVSIIPINGVISSTSHIVCASWTSDGNLVYCDSGGNVFFLSSDGKRRSLIVRGEHNTLPSNRNPLIETFRTGVILVNKQSQILIVMNCRGANKFTNGFSMQKFYRKPTGSNRVKSGCPWKSLWSIQTTSHPIFMVRCPHSDGLLLCGDRGEILELSFDAEEDSPRIRVLSYLGSNYKFLTSVNPLGGHVVAIDEHQRLDILQCTTGQLVGNMCLKSYGQVRCVVSHPTLPIIAIGTAIGKCVLVNVAKISEPSVRKIIYLQRESLDRIRYSWSAEILGVANNRLAKLFLIDDSKDKINTVLKLLNLPVEIIDFLIYETGDKFSKILVLVKTSKTQFCGQKIIIYLFNHEKKMEECESVVELPNMLELLNYGRNTDEIIVVPFLTKQMNFITIEGDFQTLNMTDAFSSGHQLRNIAISVANNCVVTCSYDGLIIIRNKTNIQQVMAIFMAHHRQEGGAKFAIFSSDNNTLVSLGRNGDLAATRICNLEVDVNISESENLAISTHELEKIIDEDDVTWVEQCLAVKLHEEQQNCAAERSSILQDFHDLRKRLKLLLDANEQESANAQLPLSDFDLDQVTRSQKIHENIASQKNLSLKLEEEIFQRDQVAKYIRELCWDCMEVPACTLLSINGETAVDNFPVPRISKIKEDRRKWENFTTELKPPENGQKKEVQKVSDHLLIMGTTTHRWIPEIPILLGNQMKRFVSFTEGRRLCTMIRDQERKLKIYFNKHFEDMRTVKDHELAMTARNINEIQECAAELKNMFGIEWTKPDDMLQPLWHCSEKPETIVTVTDHEILEGRSATFLERDIRRELMRKQEEESLKLHDQFREGALEKMMDGLLEVRWEDEIKRDPPKPLCLLNKDPSSCTEKEMEAVEIYRMKCQELKVEREKYRKLLEDKISSVQDALRRDANAFDRKVAVFYLDRMKIESAVLQETLMRLRESQRHSLRRRGMEIMRLAHNELDSAAKEYRNLIETSTSLETVVNETRNRYENLTKRDKLLEGKFRGEFPDLKQPMVEHLLRQYRKRPRNVQLTCTSVTYLTEIARCMVNGEKSEILPRDCLDFLRGMDSLDIMPNNLPAQIDVSHWQLLCKLRRSKVELEIKIKSCAVDLAEAEQTLSFHQKSCSNSETRLSQLKAAMKERELEHFEALEDMQVQLVLKMGQIECRLYGDPNELTNALLVPFHLVERANNKIIAEGRNKIIAMRKTVEFRRSTLWQEWRHKCMRMTLQDLREELKMLEGVKVTKEMQYYLQTSLESVEDEKEAKMCERIVMTTKERFERMLKDEKRQLIEASDKVTVWRMENKRLVDAIEKTKLSSFKASMLAHDGRRERDLRHRGTKLKVIMKRTRLTKKIQDNYEELLALQTQLELLRLKTYPTLRLKGLVKDKPTINKTE